MYQNNRILAIIPARGGSKGIPRKNIQPLDGKPLVAHTIEQALSSRFIDRVIVSTDDEEIAQLSRKFGADVPFLRPTELAMDDTPDLPVFLHALKWMEKNQNYVPDLIVHLRPTSPLRRAKHIDKAIEILAGDENADSIRGVCEPGQNPFKMWQITDKYMEPLIKTINLEEPYNAPRQVLPKVYWQNGHIEVTRYKTITEKNSMTGDKILPYVMDQKYSIDIDSDLSIKLAEIILMGERDGVAEK